MWVATRTRSARLCGAKLRARIGQGKSTAGQREVSVSRCGTISFAQGQRTSDKETTESKLYPLLSILLALALALIEWAFFFQGANWEGPSGPFAPDRLGFNLAWLTLIYLTFQLLSIPLAIGARERFIGVLDGMASVVPFGVSLVVIFGKPELLGTPQRWEAAFLLLSIAAIDLFGGYMFNIALSRRTMDVASPAI